MSDSISEERALSDVTKELTKDLLEQAMKNGEAAESVTLKDFSVKWASKLGDNMATYVLRINVIAQRDDAEEEHSLILKTTRGKERMSELLLKARYFRKEIGAYTKLLPALIKMQEDMGINAVVPSVPKYLYGREDAVDVSGMVILKDMRPEGFRVIDKRHGASLDHCELVMKELATWHALMLALKNKDVQSLRSRFGFAFQGSVFSSSFDVYHNFKESIENMVSLVQWSPLASTEVKDYAKKLLAIEDPHGVVRKAIQPEEPFAVICHGDSWCNNILFRYENINGVEKPVAVTLLDLQILRYALPTTDLSYFLFQNTSRNLRKAHLQSLLKLYHTTFMSVLRHVRVEIPEFTLDAVKRMFRKTAIFGILVATVSIPFFLAQPEDLDAMQKLRSEATTEEEMMKRMEALTKNYKQKQERKELSENDLQITERFVGIVEEALELDIF